MCDIYHNCANSLFFQHCGGELQPYEDERRVIYLLICLIFVSDSLHRSNCALGSGLYLHVYANQIAI